MVSVSSKYWLNIQSSGDLTIIVQRSESKSNSGVLLFYVWFHQFIFFPNDLTRKVFIYMKQDDVNSCENHHGKDTISQILLRNALFNRSSRLCFKIKFPKKEVEHFLSFQRRLSWVTESESRNVHNCSQKFPLVKCWDSRLELGSTCLSTCYCDMRVLVFPAQMAMWVAYSWCYKLRLDRYSDCISQVKKKA